MSSALQQAGALVESSKYAPLWVNHMLTGLVTQRNPLREGAVPYLYEKFYSGSRFDSLLDGLNVEITPDLTLARRPGLSVYNTQLFQPINRFHEFRTFSTDSERIYVMVDTSDKVYDGTGPNTKAVVLNKAGGAGSTYFQAEGNVLYMGNGVDKKKWRPSATDAGFDKRLSDWGTDAPADAPTDAPLAYVGAPCRYWAPNMTVQAGYAILDANGNIQLMTGNQNGAQSFTTTIAPVVDVNGVVPVSLPVSVAGASPATVGFEHSTSAFDGDPNTAASAIYLHTNQIGVCVWKFAAYTGNPPTSISLNVLSGANAPIMTGDPMTVGGWYSLDSGSTWTEIWKENIPYVRAKQWNAISIPNGQDISHIRVCFYVESHDDAGVSVYEINLVVGTATLPVELVGEKVTGDKTPDWNSQLFGNTTDGTAIWLNCGTVSQWQGNTVFSLAGPSGAIIDSNGNLQVLVTPGVSAAAQPTWATGTGETTTDGTVVWLNCGPGATVATKGYTYVYAFHTTDGEMSNASPESEPTGPILGVMKVPLAGVGSSNASCDEVWIFRIADGGNVLLKVDKVANPGAGATWSFLDTHKDADLNVLIQAPISSDNTPPPAGAINLEHHMGRIWMSVGNTVYYTRTRSAIAGDPFSCVPPANSFVFPSHVTRLWSCTIGLIVFTRSGVFIVLGRGNDTDPFWSPGTYIKGHGLLHYDAFTVNGSTAYLMTAARKVISFDPGAGVIEPGQPIGDQFKKVTTAGYNSALFSPAAAFLTWHEGSSGDTGLFVGDGLKGWFRMSSLTSPETGQVWSPFASIVGGCSAVQSIETAPGITDVLVGPPASGPGLPILRRDAAVNRDNAQSFAAYAVIGSIVMAQPGQIAELEFITVDSRKLGTRPLVKLLLGELSGRFETLARTRQDPPLLPPSKTIWNDRYSCSQNQTATYCRHFQLRFDWKAEDAHNEILAYTIFGAIHNERRSQ